MHAATSVHADGLVHAATLVHDGGLVSLQVQQIAHFEPEIIQKAHQNEDYRPLLAALSVSCLQIVSSRDIDITSKLGRKVTMYDYDQLPPISPPENAAAAEDELPPTLQTVMSCTLPELHTAPVKFHYVVMQTHNQLQHRTGGTLSKKCDYDCLAQYCTAVWPECRPWGMHRINYHQKGKVRELWREIANNQQEIDYATWERWWNSSPNRVNWDGGAKMEHLNPPGRINPNEYDKH